MNTAKDDPVGTLRRGITNWGFWHLIKLEQGQNCDAFKDRDDIRCWLVIDAYGLVDDILPPEESFMTDAEVDAKGNTEVVYVPMNDDRWAAMHGLATGDDRNESNIV